MPNLIEPLEHRRMLTIILRPGGTLHLIGTGRADVIDFEQFRRLDVLRVRVHIGAETANFATSHVRRVVVDARGGNDRIAMFNAPARSTVLGGAGDDTIEGAFSGGNFLSGGDGNDHITADIISGRNNLAGGAGDDQLICRLVAVDSNRQLRSYVTLLGGDGNDTLTGAGSVALLDGGRGNDSLTGGGGRNALFGGEGDDTLDGNRIGRDDLHGGSGIDSVDYSDHSFATLSLTNDNQANDGEPNEHDDVHSDIELIDPPSGPPITF